MTNELRGRRTKTRTGHMKVIESLMFLAETGEPFDVGFGTARLVGGHDNLSL